MKALFSNLAAILTAVGLIVTAIGSILAAYWAYKSKSTSSQSLKQSQENADNMDVLQKSVYGLKKEADGK